MRLVQSLGGKFRVPRSKFTTRNWSSEYTGRQEQKWEQNKNGVCLSVKTIFFVRGIFRLEFHGFYSQRYSRYLTTTTQLRRRRGGILNSGTDRYRAPIFVIVTMDIGTGADFCHRYLCPA